MITKQEFGILETTGEAVHRYTLRNRNGMEVTVTDFGGAVMRILVPDRDGNMVDVAGGYDTLQNYVRADGYLGALVGRTANRIGKGEFVLDGKTYRIAQNDKGNNLHGGNVGYSHRVWKVVERDGDAPALILSLHSPDGEENFPGNVDVQVVYTLLPENALSIQFEAKTDKRTPLYMTNHTYFNLRGYASGDIYGHILQMDADRIVSVDEKLIPTGVIRDVTGTPFDFRTPKPIGQDIDADDLDIKHATGYDHCYCFVGGASERPVQRITVVEPISGRVLKVDTDQPCVHLYTGNYLGPSPFPMKGGYPRTRQHAFCLETEIMPDSMNHAGFTNAILNPGETYRHTVVYRFETQK